MVRAFPFVRIFVVIGALAAWPAVAGAASMPWRTTIEDAAAAARPSNKPLMLDFWATWCAPCKVMEATVYNDPGFVRVAESFVPVRINFDDKPVIARKYKVSGLPTLVFTDSNGNELFRYVGTMTLAPLTELLESLPHDVSDFNRLNEALARNRDDLDALQGMGQSLRAAGLFRASNEHLARALQQKAIRTRPELRESMLSAMGANYLDVKDARKAADVFQRCLKEFPASPRAAEWTAGLSRAHELASGRQQPRAGAVLAPTGTLRAALLATNPVQARVD